MNQSKILQQQLEVILFYEFAITDAQQEQLQKILNHFAPDKVVRRVFRASFKQFARSVGAQTPDHKNADGKYDFSEVQLTRALQKDKMPTNSALRALLLDFALEELPHLIKTKILDGVDQKEVAKDLKLLGAIAKPARQDLSNPFLSLAADVHLTDVASVMPSEICKRFIGYRRSSRNEDVMRFYFRIFRPKDAPNGFVEYENRYSRANSNWVVKGKGLFAKDRTLYLFGHARDRARVRTRGFRIQAFQQIPGNEKLLCGPAISRDNNGPIAARGILIPLDLHKLTEPQSRLSHTQLVKSLQQLPDPEDRQRYISEIDTNVGHLFTKPNGDRDPDGLYRYLSNITPTVIRCMPPDGDEIDHQIMKCELELRRISFNNESERSTSLGYRSLLRNALEEYTSKNRS